MSISVIGSDAASGFAETVSVTVPATAQANDLVVIYGATSRWPSFTTPGTFTKLHETLSGSGTSWEAKLALWVGVVGVDCAASDVIAIGNAGGGSNNYGATLACLRSDTGGVPSYEPGAGTGFGVLADPGDTAPTAPSITLSEDGVLLFTAQVSQSSSGNTSTPPSGYTEREDVNRAGIGLTLASKNAVAGSSGTATSTAGIAGGWVTSHLHVYDTSAGGDDITAIEVTPSTATIDEAATVQLTATATGVTGSPDESVSWSSSDAGTATVDSAGLVMGVAAGTATITATSNFDGALTDTATITVETPTGGGASVSVVASDSAFGFGYGHEMTVPADAQANDLVVFYLGSNYWADHDVPAAFTKLGPVSAGSDGDGGKFSIFYGVVGTDCAAGEAIQVGTAADGSMGGTNNFSVAMVVLRASDNSALTVAPADLTGIGTGLGTAAPTAPSVALPADGVLLFGMSIDAGPGTSGGTATTPPSGYSEIQETAYTRASLHVAQRAALASEGTSGTAAATTALAGNWMAGHTLVYASGGGGDPDVDAPTVTLATVHGSGVLDSVHTAAGYNAGTDELTVTGTAADTGGSGLASVEVRVDGGAWQAATGTSSWSIDLSVSAWTAGQHTLEARATDGDGNVSTLASDTVWHSPDGVWGAAATPGEHLEPIVVEGFTA